MWKQGDEGEGFGDQEAPGLGHDLVTDEKSRLGWELALSPHSCSFLGQSDQKPPTEVWGLKSARNRGRTQQGFDSDLCQEVG